MTSVSRLGIVLFVRALVAASPLFGQDVTIEVDASRPGPPINPRMYGIFLEEIGHGVDGGLYGELVRNRGFEDARSPEGYQLREGRWVDEHGFDSGFDEFGYAASDLPFWSPVRSGDAQGILQLDRSGGVSPQSAYCLRLTVERLGSGRFGVSNSGFFGIGASRGSRYALSLHARGEGFRGPLAVLRLGETGRHRRRVEEARGHTDGFL